jgi:1-acyl-sn-glycerol-3-phosphate acyltransferase
MFPEGTRSDGSKILKFKAGAKMVANKFSLKIQPVLLFNTRSIVDSKNLKAKPGLVKVIYLEPVQANKGTTWFEDLEISMKSKFEEELRDNVA